VAWRSWLFSQQVGAVGAVVEAWRYRTAGLPPVKHWEAEALPQFYTIKQAAGVVGVSADHIRRAVSGGMLAASNVGTMARPTYRIARADLLAWVERGQGRGCCPGLAPQENRHPAEPPSPAGREFSRTRFVM
jgi:excisionase family DNA binding protein